MNNMDANDKSKREVWVDYVKVFACVLVVLGHFFQSMVKADIMQESAFHIWFDDTIYLFHVPLFFICSGYLFQKYSNVDSVKKWLVNVFKKLVALGIPYFVFSLCTWILKSKFSSAVNSEVSGLVDTLFNKPLSPYWYLYTLFFLFCISVTLRSRLMEVAYVLVAFGLKILSLSGVYSGVYFIDKTMSNYIWFVLGAVLAYEGLYSKDKKTLIAGSIAAVLFIVASILIQMYDVKSEWIKSVMTLLACYTVIALMRQIYRDKESKVLSSLAKYTMPVFLMHTLFAATLRAVLLKMSFTNTVGHIVLGLLISFVGPIIAIIIMEKIKLDILVYPTRYIKVR